MQSAFYDKIAFKLFNFVRIIIQMSSLEIRVCGRYRLEDKLYEGKFSTIYAGRNVQSDTDCSIKCEPKAIKPSLVNNEGKVLEEIQGGIGIPNLLWHGENGDFNFLITELLGTTLNDYLELCDGKFSLKTVLMIADKILSSLQFIHYKNFVHRDVQPGNFLMGLGKKLQQIYTIDYAFAIPYFQTTNNRHRPDHTNLLTQSFVGTLKFSSLNVLKGHRHSRRDDLQSLGLMLVYFLKGLPWDDEESDLSPKARRKEILKMMQSTTLQDLCSGIPKQFITYLQYCRNLKYDQNPDYNYIKRLFKQKLIRQGYQYDYIFDWILLPLRLKDTKLSNRIPLNRIPKKQSTDPALCNADYLFKEDFEYFDNWIKLKKAPKQAIQDSRTGRSMSTTQPTNNSSNKPVKNVKRTKQDCIIY